MPTLSDDVLDSIFENCLPPSLVSISQVSSHLYALALPRLVRKVALIDARQAHGFLQFVLRHGQQPSPFPQGIAHHIWELWLDVLVFGNQSHYEMGTGRSEGHPDYSCSQLAPMLSSALRGMTNLQRFGLKCNAESAMKHSPDFASALLSLRSLQSLTLTDIWGNASDALGGAVSGMEVGSRSPIRTLQLLTSSPYLHRPGPIYPSFNRFLSHLSPHLANLDINNLDLSGLLSEITSTPVVFPNVLRLRISRCCVSLQEVSSAFPNVANLETVFPLDFSNARPHRLAHDLFPYLTVAKACFDHIADIIKSPVKFGQQREIRRLDVLAFIQEHHNLPNILSKIIGLKSLYLRQRPVVPAVWWKDLVKTTPELVLLQTRLYVESQEEFEFFGTQLPPIFSSIPLECIMVELRAEGDIANDVDAAEFAIKLTLSWARSVSTLKHTIVELERGLSYLPDTDTCGLEIVRSENGTPEARPIPWDKVDEVREGYNRWK
ncbi:hypothetical protein BKA70DRAFT_1326734 [Coprinopsis sp. MPI-PUGE-AT-0042]|nr:hypothetical protein BKA70DRAFT_1326734 [Coprinopsis sp. MPI-PUGE-AT-0042]